MAVVTLKGSPSGTIGALPEVGAPAPDFVLTAADLTDVSLADVAGSVTIVNIVPSLDTGVCAASARRFDKEVAARDGVVCLNVSRDLPFAQTRFCKTEGTDAIVTLSSMRDDAFGRDWGCVIVEGPFSGLLSRAVVVLDGANVVRYTQQVPEIAQEPDYEAVLSAVDSIR